MFRFRGISARWLPTMRTAAALLVVALSPIAVCAEDGSWRLVVVNGRRLDLRSDRLDEPEVRPTFAAFASAGGEQAQWSLQLGHVPPPLAHRTSFGSAAGVPVAGDFNGDGFAELGIFVEGRWQIDLNANNRWDEGDLELSLGGPGDRPVVGDWDGDGKADIGVYTPGGTEFGAVPVVGDWTGAGVDRIGVFRDGVWRLDVNGDGLLSAEDVTVRLGATGDRPVVGDFNRDGRDDLGVYRDGRWHLDLSGDRRLGDDDLQFTLGDGDDQPVVGDWDGDGRDQIGLVHR